jgi:YVTN family beta-propeller protein
MPRHWKVRLSLAAWLFQQMAAAAQTLPGSGFLSPEELALSQDGRYLFVSCLESGEAAVIDLNRPGLIAKRVRCGRMPRGIAVSRDRVYVANSWDDTVSEINAATHQVLRTFDTGMEPIGLAIDGSRNRLFTVNRLSGDVTAIDLGSGKRIASIPVGRGASYGTISGTTLFVSRIYPSVDRDQGSISNWVGEIDIESLGVRGPTTRLGGWGAGFKIAASTAGGPVIIPSIFPRNFLPTSHVDGGGLVVNGLTVVDGQRATAVPIDTTTSSSAQPFDAVHVPAEDALFVSASAADEVLVVNLRRLLGRDRQAPATEPVTAMPTDLSTSAGLIRQRVAVGRNPRGMVYDRRRGKVYVANRMDDTISVIDAANLKVTSIGLVSEPQPLTPQRRGARLFHSSAFARVRQFSCSTCHIDNLSDGLAWDLEQDGFGADIVATKSLESLRLTAPFKWSGVTPDLATECGPLSERYFFRSEGFRGQALSDLVAYLESIPPRPNRFRKANGFTPAQVEGKQVFERKKTNDGREILFVLQCPACHAGPAYTVNSSFSVGTKTRFDRTGTFDTPGLINAAFNVNFLHDGSAADLFELWTTYNMKDLHGVTSDLTKGQIQALVEYLKTL